MARVLLFGSLGELAGWREREVEASGLAELRARLLAAQPQLTAALERPGVQVALDKVLIRGEATLTTDSEVAFMPPMSGG